MPSKLGLARIRRLNITASRVTPTCGDKRGHDGERMVRLDRKMVRRRHPGTIVPAWALVPDADGFSSRTCDDFMPAYFPSQPFHPADVCPHTMAEAVRRAAEAPSGPCTGRARCV